MSFNQYNTPDGSAQYSNYNNRRNNKGRPPRRRSKLGCLIPIITAAIIIVTFKIVGINPLNMIFKKDGFTAVRITEDNEYGGKSYQGFTGGYRIRSSQPIKMGEFPEGSVKSLQKTAPLLCEAKYSALTLDYHKNEELMKADINLQTKEDVKTVGAAYKEFYQGYDLFNEDIYEAQKDHPDGPFPRYTYACIKGKYQYKITIDYYVAGKRTDISIEMNYLENFSEALSQKGSQLGFEAVSINEDNWYGGKTYRGESASDGTEIDKDRANRFPESAVNFLQETAPLLCGTEYTSLEMTYHRDETLRDAEMRLITKQGIEEVGAAYKELYQNFDYFIEEIGQTDENHPDGPFPCYDYACVKGSYKYVVEIQYIRQYKEVSVSINIDHLDEAALQRIQNDPDSHSRWY